jgi:1-phosphofructokinase family hexose kinase
VESGEGPPTTFNEKGPEISPDKFDELIQRSKELSAKADWVVLGGSIPPGLPNDAFKTLIEACGRGTCNAVLDADGEPMMRGLEARPTFIKPNAKEAGRLLGRKVETSEDALIAAKELLQKLEGRDKFVVISLGQDGAVLACAEGLFIGETPKVDTRSTIGSGDSLIGGMLWALKEDKPLPEALRWGLAAGAATAMTDGTEIARKAHILELLPQARVQRA